MKKIAVFSRSFIPTHPLSEFLFHQNLKKLGFDSHFFVFNDDPRLNRRSTESLIRPRSFLELQNNAISISPKISRIFFFNTLHKKIDGFDWVFTRPIMRDQDWVIHRAISKCQSKPKLGIYSLNSVGARTGSVPPDLYLSPGSFWHDQIQKEDSFLTGLKMYSFPFMKKEKKEKPRQVIPAGMLCSYDIEDTTKNVSAKTFKKAYGIKNKLITVCLESSTKYIDEKGNPFPLIDFTVRTLKSIQNLLGAKYQFAFKLHPFQYEKPFPSYDRLQISRDLFSEFGPVICPDDGFVALKNSEFALLWNTSVAYEAALCGTPSVVIASEEEDFKTKDRLFRGGFFTPEIYGLVCTNFEDFSLKISSLLNSANEAKLKNYTKSYGNHFPKEKKIFNFLS